MNCMPLFIFFLLIFALFPEDFTSICYLLFFMLYGFNELMQCCSGVNCFLLTLSHLSVLDF